MNQRRHPPMRLTVPVYKGPVTYNRMAAIELSMQRNDEARNERLTIQEQLLSNRLSWRYRRDIHAAAGMPSGAFQVEYDNGRIAMYVGVPRLEHLETARFRRMKVSLDVAERLLARDGRMVA